MATSRSIPIKPALSARQIHPALLPFGLFVLALALRLFRLTTQSLWLDEGGTWNEVTSRSWSALFSDLWSPRAAYPLYHLLMKAWIALAGDEVWALRVPSALAGAALVPLVWLLGRRVANQQIGVLAALLLLFNPLALWQAQDAKVYSMLLLLFTLALLCLWQALTLGGAARWWRWLGMCLLLVFTHRLALLAVIGMVGLVVEHAPRTTRWRWLGRGLLLVLIGGLVVGLRFGLQQDPQAPAIGTNVGPAHALWWLLGRWPLDRLAEQYPLLRLPWALLLALGVGWSVRQGSVQVHQTQFKMTARRLIGWTGGLPLLLFLLILAGGIPLYEVRYVSFLLPIWAITTAFGVVGLSRLLRSRLVMGILIIILLGMQLTALWLRPYGVWSGNAVKENYRAAIAALAQRLTPEDGLVIHPPYIEPLYRYYAPRVTPDRLPRSLAFGRVGAADYNQREFYNDYAALLSGYRRAWLLIAPLNARAIDPPNPIYPQDDMGMVGINFLTADMNQKWRCVDVPYLDFGALRLLCQSFPAPLRADSPMLRGAWSIPRSDTASWNGTINLLGYAFKPWRSDGNFTAGGTMPLELTWNTTTVSSNNYRLFVHLVPRLGAPIAAQLDTAPLAGGLPTSQWPINKSIHDQLAVPLPAEITPGRYLVLLGWYDPAIAEVRAQRLPVTMYSGMAGADYVELGTIEVRQP